MPGIDDVTPHIEIEGIDEIVAQFKAVGEAAEDAFSRIGEAAASVSKAGDVVEKAAEAGKTSLKELGVIGAEAFSKIIEAASNGNLVGVVTALFGRLAGTIAEVAEKTTAFIEAQATMVETLSALGEATGTTLAQIEGLKDAFASVGISTSGFERAFGRMAITISNDWSEIQKVVRTSADEQTGAMLHVQETALGVQRAYNALNEAFTSAVTTAQHDATALESASLGLRSAMSDLADFSQKSAQNSLSIESAAMSLESAKRRLFKDQGGQVSAADEKAFKIAQDQLAVQEAQNRLQEAYRQKQKEALDFEEAQLKVKKAQQELAAAEQKQIEDSAKASERIRDAQLGIDKAKLASSEALEKQHQQELKDLPAIAKEVENVASGYKTWDQVMNHAEITARDLAKAVILATSAGSGEPPKAIEVFKELTKVFEHMGNSTDAQAKKLEIVQNLFAAGFRSGQASAAQMVAVIDRGSEAIDGMTSSMERFSQSIKLGEARDKLLEFNAALSQMEGAIDVVKTSIAGQMAPGFTKAFNEIKESITTSGRTFDTFVNIIRDFIDIIGRAAQAVVGVISGIAEAINSILKVLSNLTGLKPDVVFTVMAAAAGVAALAITGVGRAIAMVMARMVLWTAIIGTVVLALGNLYAAYLMVFKGQSELQAHNNDIENSGKAILRSIPGVKPGEDDKKVEQAIEAAAHSQIEAAGKTGEAAGKTGEAASKTGEAAAKQTEAASIGAEKLTEAGASIQNNASFAADKLSGAAGALTDAAAAIKAAVANLGKPPGMAEGGSVHGPGGPTDDSAGLFALSNGEYVMRSAAVQHYGSSLFDALNGLAVGGFATGGMVGGPRAPSTPSSMGGPTSIVNLAIDGQHFNGLRAPENVASKLKTYAVTRQASSAGKLPTWMR